MAIDWYVVFFNSKNIYFYQQSQKGCYRPFCKFANHFKISKKLLKQKRCAWIRLNIKSSVFRIKKYNCSIASKILYFVTPLFIGWRSVELDWYQLLMRPSHTFTEYQILTTKVGILIVRSNLLYSLLIIRSNPSNSLILWFEDTVFFLYLTP